MTRTTPVVGRWLAEQPGRTTWTILLSGSLASAALLAACSGLQLPWLLLVAPLPWLLALDRLARRRHVLAAGAALGVAFTALVFPWFPDAAHRYSDLPIPLLWALLLLLAPLLQPQFLVLALVRHLIRREGGKLWAARAALGGACAYVGTELVYPKLFFDTLGQGLYPSPFLRQAADLVGVHGLTLAVLLIAEALCWAIFPRFSRGASLPPPPRRRVVRFGPLAAAALLIAVWLGYGSWRRAALLARPTAPLQVGVVQANITAYEKLRAEKGAFETVRIILDTHVALSDELLSTGKPDLVIWPETVYPTTFGAPRSEAGASFDLEIESFVTTRGVPLVLGAFDAEDGAEYNASFFLSPVRGGRPRKAVYRKRWLFPLTEWVPPALEGPTFRSIFPWAGTWTRGPGPRTVDLPLRDRAPLSVLPLICYDTLSGSFVAEAAARGADLMITLSNDSWFPDQRAPRLHLVAASFRSVETGLPQVRATNSGISAVISPTGDILGEIPWDRRSTLLAPVPLGPRTSPPAVTWGARLLPVTWLLACLALLHAMATGRARRAGKAPAESPSVTPEDETRRSQERRQNKRSD